MVVARRARRHVGPAEQSATSEHSRVTRRRVRTESTLVVMSSARHDWKKEDQDLSTPSYGSRLRNRCSS